jgi:molybdenum cofactor biosynthesis enzyme MoaA
VKDFDLIRETVQKWPCSRVQEVQSSLIEKAPLFDVEVSSICNLKCEFCPRDKVVRKNKFMESDIFDILYNWLPDNAIVMFSGLGECLLNKNLSSYIQKLKERNISSCIVTNGVFLTPEKQKELIESGIDQIQVSYLTCNESVYNDLTGNRGDFNSLNFNLQKLSEIKPADLRVQLNFIDLGVNHRSFSLVKEAALNWDFDIFYRREHSRGGLNTRSLHMLETDDCCFRCGTFASVHFITSDGNIILCCNDAKAVNILSNITSSDYASMLKNKLKIMLKNTEFDVCKRCTDDYRWHSLFDVI